MSGSRSRREPANAKRRAGTPGQAASGGLPQEDVLQARLGHFFRDQSLLRMALTHPSAAVEAGLPRRLSYERLEFLGDSVLNFLVADLVFHRFPAEEEGVLTRVRAHWISRRVLAAEAEALGVGAALRMGEGERRDGGAGKERVLASAFEALLGALYLDAGVPAARRAVSAIFSEPIRKRGLAVLEEDAKTRLQETRQAANLPLPVYATSPAEGGGFVATVSLDGLEAGSGKGPTRKAAEQAAARAALQIGGGETGPRG
ncbi:MAG: ribonuclease III [Acidobacteriota bacterium]